MALRGVSLRVEARQPRRRSMASRRTELYCIHLVFYLFVLCSSLYRGSFDLWCLGPLAAWSGSGNVRAPRSCTSHLLGERRFVLASLSTIQRICPIRPQ